MPIDDPESPVRTEIREETQKSIQEMLARSAAVGAASLVDHLRFVPYGVGAAITEMLTELAIRRSYERMGEMFDEFDHRVREVGETKIDREYFKSEEFQTLLFEALRQLHVTHDKERIAMLGRALANSGSSDFKDEDRKESFLQLVRTLTPKEVAMLQELMPSNNSETPEDIRWFARPTFTSQHADLLTMQPLVANGLVEDELSSDKVNLPNVYNVHDANRVIAALKDEFQKPPIRKFRLSRVGFAFLNFVGVSKNTD